jgi:uncharacterized protein YbaP (TraB family)
MQGRIIERWWGQVLGALLLLSMAAGVPAHATERGALFKVAGGGHTLYLFGTMHVGRPDFYPFEKRLDAALAKAPVLALEIDPGFAPEVAARAMQKYAAAPPGMTTPPALASRLAAALAAQGIPPDALAAFKPWLVATVLSVGEFTKLGYSQADAVDVRLAQLARQRKVKVIELESVESQMALLNSLSLEQQWTFVDETLTQMASGEAAREAHQIANAWATADQKGLEKIAAKVEQDDSVGGKFTREVLLDGRNGALADGIAGLLAKADHSVAAIGVLHLIGKGSVPERLKNKGLSVERVY